MPGHRQGFPTPADGPLQRDRNGGLPGLSDGVAHASRCPASPFLMIMAENRGKPSLQVIIREAWYWTRPGRRVLALKPGTTFPTLHTLDLLRRARAGQKIFWHKVFDGSDELKTFGVSTVVTAALGLDKRFSGQPLLHRPGWRVRISYFDPKAGKSRPDYAIVMDLKDNGVTANLSLHYSGFSLNGALRKLEALPVARC